jgi:hypothetical protein
LSLSFVGRNLSDHYLETSCCRATVQGEHPLVLYFEASVRL